MRKRLFLFALLLGLGVAPSGACTSAIFTGKVTANGRPLLWKHRDTGQEQNRIAYFTTGRYAFLALVDVRDPSGVAWTGTNSQGFSIINTASYNLKDDDVQEMDHEGLLMYRALEVCATLADFEVMLDTLTRPMRVEANFGVIDAQGGAAYYEVNNHKWVKMDANDPAVAPNGYLIYTNHSFTGRLDEGMGYIRYQNATHIVTTQAPSDGITPSWIFKNLSRSFYHAQLGVDLCQEAYSPEKGTGWFIDQDFIVRKTSACSIVIEGVPAGKDPLETVMWTALGYPPASIVVPLWVAMGSAQPEYVTASANESRAFICQKAVDLKHKTFSITRGNGDKYMHFSLIFNSMGTGYMQQLERVEGDLFRLYYQTISSLQHSQTYGATLNKKVVTTMYQQTGKAIYEVYATL